MIIYEVNITIDKNIFGDFYPWLISHVKEMLQFDGFEKATIGLIDAKHDQQMRLLRVDYWIKSLAELEEYLEKDAPNMRAEGVERFGKFMTITRRVLPEHITIHTS